MVRNTIKIKNTVNWQAFSCVRSLIPKLTILALCLATASIGRAQPPITFMNGMTGGGAFYLIAVPEDWNGDLVIWNHGFTLDAPEPLTKEDLGPLAPIQLDERYAVAASSFRQAGWALFKTKNDLQNMFGEFKDQFGEPNEVIVTGASLGGAVTAQAIEKANLGNVVGAYSLCGAVAGSRNWDGALDLRLIYDVVAAGIPGAEIPGGAEGLPEDSILTEFEIAMAVNVATGVLLSPTFRTPDQAANLATILALARIPENFLIKDMFYATLNMSDLVHDKHKLNSRLGTGNAAVDYGDNKINDSIDRVSPHPGAENRLERNFTPTGDVGDTKIIAIHTDKDGLVVVENQSDYAYVVPAENLTVAIAVEDEPSHCDFTEAEALAGWESLRAWIAGFPQPTAADIQGVCVDIENTTSFEGPCRFVPGFVIPDMDERIRPR
jgi:hypothetical protein